MRAKPGRHPSEVRRALQALDMEAASNDRPRLRCKPDVLAVRRAAQVADLALGAEDTGRSRAPRTERQFTRSIQQLDRAAQE